MVIRFPIAVLLGALLTLLVYWVLWKLISQPIDAQAMREATRIEFTRMRKDTEVASKRENKAERDKPPPTPEVPKMAFQTGNVDSNVASMTPTVDPRGAMSGLNISAGSDRDIIPLVRVPPDYPPRAQNRGLEGWVIVSFSVTGAGAVKDCKIVKSSNQIFEDAACKAVLRWRYNPKIENGQPIDRVGLQVKFPFVLEN